MMPKKYQQDRDPGDGERFFERFVAGKNEPLTAKQGSEDGIKLGRGCRQVKPERDIRSSRDTESVGEIELHRKRKQRDRENQSHSAI